MAPTDLQSVLQSIDRRKAQGRYTTVQRQERKQYQEGRKKELDAIWKILDADVTGEVSQTDVVKMLVQTKCENLQVQLLVRGLESEAGECSSASAADNQEDVLPKTMIEIFQNGYDIEDCTWSRRDLDVYFEGVNLPGLHDILKGHNDFLKRMEREMVVSTVTVENDGEDGQEGVSAAPSGIEEEGSSKSQLHQPRCMTSDKEYLYFSDTDNSRIQRMHVASGVVSTLCGGRGEGMKDGFGEAAQFNHPLGLEWDYDVTIYICDTHNNAIRAVSIIDGEVWTVHPQLKSDGTPLTDSMEAIDLDSDQEESDYLSSQMDCPYDLAYVPEEEVVYVTSEHRVQRVDVINGACETVAGDEFHDGYSNGPAIRAWFNTPRGIAYVPSIRALVICDFWNHRIRKVSLPSFDVTTLAGDGTAGFLDGNGMYTQLNGPCGLTSDGRGSVYIADSNNNSVRKLNLCTGKLVTVAGSATRGWTDGFGPYAQFNGPQDLLYRVSDDTVYVSDTRNCICRVLKAPKRPEAEGKADLCFCVVKNGLTYITDCTTHMVSLFDPATNQQVVVAGSGTCGFLDGPLLEAMFDQPRGVAVDSNNELYVADYGNHRIRKLVQTGEVITVAGTGNPGCTDGPAKLAQLDSPYNLTYVESENCLLFGCSQSFRRLNLDDMTIFTVAAAPSLPDCDVDELSEKCESADYDDSVSSSAC